MQFTSAINIVAAITAALFASQAAAAPGQLVRRNCPLTKIDAVTEICQEFLGAGNDASIKCIRLFEEVAAQNCLCAASNGTVLYDPLSDNKNGHAYCSTHGPCWF